jgi:hypothetical protein
MALTPELDALKKRLVDTGYAKRTHEQDRLLAELEAIDEVVLLKSLNESVHASVMKMTSPGTGGCPCCGR